jgi:hypothetical protein
MSKLNQLFQNPADQRPGPNCGVTALAVSAGISFEKAWQTFRAVNPRVYNKRWKGGTYTSDQTKALERLQIAFYNLPVEKTNLKNFVRDYTQRDTVYMVTTGRHVQTVLNGHVIDQQGKKHIAEYWGRKKFVQNVRVIKEPFKYADNAGSDTAPMPAKPLGITTNARQLMLF